MKNILFITGTRADFGKIKSLIKILDDDANFKVHVFITGMHLIKKYGYTVNEIIKSKFKNIYFKKNQNKYDTMDIILAKTIKIISSFIKQHNIDLIILHGDRVEALATAIVGTMNNILTAHIEGGEVSGTIDESIRHANSKLSHIHFVSNNESKNRLIQMGENNNNIYVIGSPDIDIMFSDKLENINFVKNYYNITFDNYAIFCFHPITTATKTLENEINEIIKGLVDSNKKYIVIYPNNDLGSDLIINKLKQLNKNTNFKIFPSLRFEYFLVLLKNSDFVIGNSSMGIREAPIYGVPTIDIGNRQKNRYLKSNNSIFHIDDITEFNIIKGIDMVKNIKTEDFSHFGTGNSAFLFHEIINDEKFWDTELQKQFIDL